jgi:hypothetical protein
MKQEIVDAIEDELSYKRTHGAEKDLEKVI